MSLSRTFFRRFIVGIAVGTGCLTASSIPTVRVSYSNSTLCGGHDNFLAGGFLPAQFDCAQVDNPTAFGVTGILGYSNASCQSGVVHGTIDTWFDSAEFKSAIQSGHQPPNPLTSIAPGSYKLCVKIDSEDGGLFISSREVKISEDGQDNVEILVNDFSEMGD